MDFLNKSFSLIVRKFVVLTPIYLFYSRLHYNDHFFTWKNGQK